MSGNPGEGTAAYSYSGTTKSGASYGPSAAPPTQAGDYTVTATVAETANYLGGISEPADFTIAPKPITATVTAQDKTYDGTTGATVSATVNASDLAEADLDEGVEVKDGEVTISGLKGTFEDKSVGENKAIELDYDEVTSPVANPENYDVGGEMPTASIKPRSVYVKAEDKTSRHGQAIVELTYSLDGSSELVEGDTLASLGINATTTASSSSSVGTYPITLSGGTGNANYDVYFVEGGTYTITQAEGLTKSIRVVGLMKSVDQPSPHWATEITQSVKNMMPSDAGTLSYTAGTPSYKVGESVGNLPDGFTLEPTMNHSTGEVSATLQITKEAAEAIEEVGEITLPVTVTSQNYEDSTINVVVVPKGKAEQEVSIEGVPDSVIYGGDTSFTLTATVKDAQGNVVETHQGDWYWYSSDPNVLEVPEVTNPYSASSTMSVTVENPGSAMILAWYEPNGGDTIGAAVTDPITVEKLNINPSVTIEGWAYGEKPKMPTVTGNTGNGAVTYEYKAKGADDSAYIEDIPTEAGKYTMRATVLESTYHKGDTCTADFTIAKKPVDATVTAADKTYDGTADANVSATVSAGVLEGDVVTVASIGGRFADANVGEGKSITLDAGSVSLAGEDSANYEVRMPSDPITASISPRPVTIKADNQSRQYGQALATLTYGPYGSTKLAKGDTLASLGVTASTTATSKSDVGSYPITLTGGTRNANYKVTLKDATYTITKAENPMTIRIKGWTYSDKPKAPTSKAAFGSDKVVYSYAASKDGKYSAKVPTNVGTWYVKASVSATANYAAGKATASFKIKPAVNALTVKTKAKTVKFSKKKQTASPITKAATTFKTKVTYAKATTAKAKKLKGYKVLTVNKKTDKVTVKKGAKPGTYKLMVKVTAAAVKSGAAANVKAASKTVTVKVKVKSAKSTKSAKAQSAGLQAGGLATAAL